MKEGDLPSPLACQLTTSLSHYTKGDLPASLGTSPHPSPANSLPPANRLPPSSTRPRGEGSGEVPEIQRAYILPVTESPLEKDGGTPFLKLSFLMTGERKDATGLLNSFKLETGYIISPVKPELASKLQGRN